MIYSSSGRMGGWSKIMLLFVKYMGNAHICGEVAETEREFDL